VNDYILDGDHHGLAKEPIWVAQVSPRNVITTAYVQDSGESKPGVEDEVSAGETAALKTNGVAQQGGRSADEAADHLVPFPTPETTYGGGVEQVAHEWREHNLGIGKEWSADEGD
jgi:hypothetical protein